MLKQAILLVLFHHLPRLLNAQAFDRCFSLYPNLQMRCATPLERRTSVTKDQCQESCLTTPGCRSAQYDQYKQQCDLFAIPSPLDAYTQPPPPFALQDQYDRFTSGVLHRDHKRETRQLLNPGNAVNDLCEPSMVPSIGVIFMSPSESCAAAAHLTSSPAASSMRAPAAAARRIVQPLPQPVAHLQTNRPQVLPVTPGCGPGEGDKFELVDGIELVAGPRTDVLMLTVESADVCLQHCRMNAFPDGNRFPILCRSAQFNRVENKCTISDQAIQPNGIAQFIPNVNIIYFERICLKEQSWTRGCDDLINRVPRRILLGHATAVVDSPSTQHCLEQCLQSQNAFGFRCSSALLFYEFPTANCVLNRHSRHTRPAHFIPEDRQKVDYFELPPCLRTPNQVWRRDEMWSEWSECDPQVGIERRSRCGGGNEICDSVQTRDCLSEEKFRKEFPKLVGEQLRSESGQRFTELDTQQPHFVGNFSGRTLRIEKPIVPLGENNALDYDEELLFFGPPMKEISPKNNRGVPREIGEKQAGRRDCDPYHRCCPTQLTKAGAVDCRHGYRIDPNSGTQVPCKPENCQGI